MNDEHKGHRQRMKKRYLLDGIDNFEQHEILEMLLFYCVPMKNTSDLAHRVISEFGSISAFFDAPIDALIEFGLSENQATFFKLMPDIARVYIDDKHNNNDKIIDSENIATHILDKFIGRENENVLTLLLDSKGKELFCGIVSKGSISTTEIPIRKIVDLALRYHAKSVVVAHNHPSGVCLPSNEDLVATVNIKNALSLIGVNLIDHFIVADNDCISLAQSAIGDRIFG